MFRDAKIGDRVWSIEFGWGHVYEIDNRDPTGRPLIVQFATRREQYCSDGRRFNRGCRYPGLYWDEVKIAPPPKPKRKVKKVAEGYLQITEYRTHDNTAFWVSNLFETKQDAISHAKNTGSLAGDPIFIRHEYEVEE